MSGERPRGHRDLSDSSISPELILKAAYRESDWTTTAVGDANVTIAASLVGSRLVQMSSDAVFSGAAVYYDETTVPDPITPSGAAEAR